MLASNSRDGRRGEAMMMSTTSWIARRITTDSHTSLECWIRADGSQRRMRKRRRIGSGRSERVEEGVE